LNRGHSERALFCGERLFSGSWQLAQQLKQLLPVVVRLPQKQLVLVTAAPTNVLQAVRLLAVQASNKGKIAVVLAVGAHVLVILELLLW